MNVAVLGTIAFVAGLGIGTGLVVLNAPAHRAVPAAEPVTVAAPDSSSVRATRAVASAGVAVESHPSPSLPAPGAIPPPVATSAAASAPPEDFAQVSKILINMKPAEAAKIIGYLSDDQVEGILRSTGVRQAALLLTQLPTERAAALSRRLMHPNPEHVQ